MHGPTWLLGDVYIFTNRAAQGIAECEQALALDRNLADAHGAIGLAKYLFGSRCRNRRPYTRGFPSLSSRYRCLPVDAFVGVAKIQLGADAEAVGWLRRSIEANRNYPLAHFSFAAALGLLGALDEARTAAQAGLALNPGFTIRRLRATKSSDNPTYLAGRERFCEGMRLAGVPEG